VQDPQRSLPSLTYLCTSPRRDTLAKRDPFIISDEGYQKDTPRNRAAAISATNADTAKRQSRRARESSYPHHKREIGMLQVSRSLLIPLKPWIPALNPPVPPPRHEPIQVFDRVRSQNIIGTSSSRQNHTVLFCSRASSESRPHCVSGASTQSLDTINDPQPPAIQQTNTEQSPAVSAQKISPSSSHMSPCRINGRRVLSIN
jgi:hypothetical protein